MPPPRAGGVPLTVRTLAGGLSLVVPEGTVLESAGYPLAGRFVSSDAQRSVRVQAAWSEAPAAMAPGDLATIQQAWLGALVASQLAPAMAPVVDSTKCATHAAARARGASAEGHEFRAASWVCPPTRRVIHVLVSGPAGLDWPRVSEHLGARSACHAAGAVASSGPKARLPDAPGWRENSVTGTRRSYLGPNGLVEAVVEEGPRPDQSPVEHVLKNAEVWGPLLSGVVGRPLPVEAPGATRVETLFHKHVAVRVHGRVQPPATPQMPLAPVLFVESTIWACPESDRLVSVSAVTPDRKAMERARSVLESASCHE